jgi:hypothetical protein
MASMNPNPFLVPLQNSAPGAIAAPPPLSPFAPAPVATPRTLLAPAPAAVAAAPSSTPELGAWSESTARTDLPPPAADVSGGVKDALLKIRRAQLARVVKGVVGVSALVCLIALVRVAIGGSHAEADLAAAKVDGAPSMQMRVDPITTAVHADIDALSARTIDAMNGVTRVTRHAPAHFTASRGHKRW